MEFANLSVVNVNLMLAWRQQMSQLQKYFSSFIKNI